MLSKRSNQLTNAKKIKDLQFNIHIDLHITFGQTCVGVPYKSRSDICVFNSITCNFRSQLLVTQLGTRVQHGRFNPLLPDSLTSYTYR